jgi:ribosome biogenesis GTPase
VAGFRGTRVHAPPPAPLEPPIDTSPDSRLGAPIDLATLGWTDALAAATPATPGLVPARVSSVYASRADVITAAGPRRAIMRGRALREATLLGGLAVGDWVTVGETVAPDESGLQEQEVVVETLLPRRTVFMRQAAGERAEPQAIAANMDIVFVVTSLDGDFSVRRLERYLVAIRSGGAEACVLLSKADIDGDGTGNENVIRDAQAIFEEASALAPVLRVSARTGQGLDALRARIGPGTTAALAGSSGVGKSALVNALLGRGEQREGEVREHDRRGRHTTTKRSLFLLPSGGLLVDTPGMRELKPWQPEGEGGETDEEVWDDIVALAAACRYRDCRHEGEPGCAVSAAAAAGTLPADRLAAYRKLGAEREAVSARQAAFAAERERRARAAAVGLRARLRMKGR